MSEEIAKRFHAAYERLAPSFGYKTRKASAVPWDDVPDQNRQLMIAVVNEVVGDIIKQLNTVEEIIKENDRPKTMHLKLLVWQQLRAASKGEDTGVTNE